MKRYWREILIGLQTIIIIVAIYFYIQMKGEIKSAQDQVVAAQLFMADIYTKNLETQKEIIAARDSISTLIKNKEVVVVTKEIKYETVKKTPIKRNYTDAELRNWLDSIKRANNIR